MRIIRKENFINDKRRVSYLHSVYNRIYSGKSVLIEGDYGAGKSRFLQLIKPKKLEIVWVESLFNIHEILASILSQLKFDVEPMYHKTHSYLKMVCNQKQTVIIVDESNDLDNRTWPYFKRIIDAGIPMIFSGLPKVRTLLMNQHPDILSRLKILVLYPIMVEDFIVQYKEFSQDAIEQIYGSTRGDMRKFQEICEDCINIAKEKNVQKIDVNLALSLIPDFLSK
ncbi:MAG: transposase (ATPase domain protein) [Candidatus Magnetoglobus multicellularis str. Araruama]|uniref:Transposase (ATPase domain protein) n=1 Tax=Candidatus Magnetoglobus multicellularis str. Araruama TaxID=890399 RepID=A0A1V1P3D5_9BACT|nr:MAG: transposase (ATPase domain protein) [Candidatus Magnetoglobus multicellularis str. Araruama]